MSRSEFQKVAIVGLGYIGLPTAAVLASRGVQVLGIDVNERVVRIVNQGSVHIIEPELDMVVRGSVNSGRLRATTTPEPADVFVLAVPTPYDPEHGPDLSYVEAAAKSIAGVLAPGNLVILESTSPVGGTEAVAAWLAEARPDLRFPGGGADEVDVHVGHCPERVLPGNVLRELVENDRIVGGLTPRCAERAAAFYSLFVQGRCLTTDARTAELVKLSENSFRDVNIAFANELSIICERLGVDVWGVIELANHHPRVNILRPGPGVGGHCIAVDPWFIVHSAPEESRLIRTAREVNDDKPARLIARIREAAADLDRPRIACLGLSYKPDIDDLRESPALRVVRELAAAGGAELLVVEPHLREPPEGLRDLDGVRLAGAEEAIRKADVVVMLVGHRAFREIDRSLLAGKRIVDAIGLWR
jgi:UDP-N-acetyl-D-mannosaminuronic acid dehydrogenase